MDTKGSKIYQMDTKGSKNIPNGRKNFPMGHKIYMPTFSIPIYPNWYFWYANVPSGNPADED
jgi:hypothetical protein